MIPNSIAATPRIELFRNVLIPAKVAIFSFGLKELMMVESIGEAEFIRMYRSV